MSKWKNLHSSTALNGMVGEIDIRDDHSDWKIWQDERPFLEQAKFDRENASMQRGHMKKFATIPDIVAIEIMEKYGIDIHDPNTMNDADKMKKFKYIIQTEYKHLMSY